MQLENESKIVKGKHNNIEFTWKDGNLEVFGKTWSKKTIKALVEIANLLDIAGYQLKEKENVSLSSIDYNKFLRNYYFYNHDLDSTDSTESDEE